MFKELDIIKLKKDYKNNKVGDIGVIIAVFDTPNEAYEVEFADEEGVPIDSFSVLPEDIELVKK